MLIKVTQEDIGAGSKKHCLKCPIALAIRRYTGEFCYVGISKVLLSKRDKHKTVTLPDAAVNFIIRFDSGLPVLPFEFELEVSFETC